MKRGIGGLVAFFSTIVLGFLAAGFFSIDVTPTTLKLESHDIPKINLHPSNEIEDFNPEFRNVKLRDQDIPFQLQLGFDGEFSLRKCELDSVRKNGRWLGLFNKEGSYSLERRSLKVGRPETDDFGTWYPTSFRNSKAAKFLFTDDGSLKLGSVKTFYEMPPRKYVNDDENSPFQSMTIGFSRRFNQNALDYTIRVAPGTDESGHQVGVVVVEHGDKQQVIYYQDLPGGIDMAIADLEWVGDLDGDGRLDLQISYFEQNGGGQNSILFLSSKAPEDSLVKAYALSHSSNPGC